MIGEHKQTASNLYCGFLKAASLDTKDICH